MEEKTVETKEPVKIETPSKSKKDKAHKQLVDDVIKNKYGTGRERMILLGDKYERVQKDINDRIRKGEV